ncbi:hypothetical protein [Pelagibius sp.]|uniref:hypothetical protein n=1 Tax=Pelagibius sp. TaxID=1931238 RepID=UPI002631D99E|nr:hypothetical protein [Pelagibius sp.]
MTTRNRTRRSLGGLRLLPLALALPLCLGGCITGLAGAALGALGSGGGGRGESSSPSGPLTANSPEALQQALAQTDDRVTPLCRSRLKAYLDAQAEDNGGVPEDPASAKAAPCGLQPLCLPGAERPTEMMVCRRPPGPTTTP